MAQCIIVQMNLSPYHHLEQQRVLNTEIISGISSNKREARDWLDRILAHQGFHIEIILEVVALRHVVSCFEISRKEQEREDLKEELREEIREELRRERGYYD